MVIHDNTYSRVVAWLKILLPLLALALLSTLFLVARQINPAQNLLFAKVDVDELAREQRIGKPKFSTVTGDGAAISLSAESARPDPDNPQRMTGRGVFAGIDLPGGTRVDVESTNLELDSGAGLATLSDGVRLTTSDGFVMTTQVVEVALNATRVGSRTPTVVKAPIGQLSADEFELIGRGDTERPYVLVFKGHVKLIYDPNE